MEPQREIKRVKNIGEIKGGFYVNVVSLKYIGMTYINVGEMCAIPMNVHNELFNGVRQLRWQHLSPVVSKCSTSIMLLSSFFIKSFLSISLYLSVVPPPVLLISGLSLRFGDVDVFFLQSNFFAIRHINIIHYPVNHSQ